MVRKDIILDDNNDFCAKQGDFVIAKSDDQHVEHLLLAQMGEYKQYPLAGIGISQQIRGKMNSGLKRSIQMGLAVDGYKAKEIKMDNEKLSIEI